MISRSSVLIVFFGIAVIVVSATAHAAIDETEIKSRFRAAVYQELSEPSKQLYANQTHIRDAPSAIPDMLASGIADCAVELVDRYPKAIRTKLWKVFAATDSLSEAARSIGETSAIEAAAGGKHTETMHSSFAKYAELTKRCYRKQAQKYPAARALFDEFIRMMDSQFTGVDAEGSSPILDVFIKQCDDDQPCIAAMKAQFPKCYAKYFDRWQTYLAANPKDQDKLESAYIDSLYRCIIGNGAVRREK